MVYSKTLIMPKMLTEVGILSYQRRCLQKWE